MSFRDRLARAEVRAGNSDFVLAAFEAAPGSDGQDLWRHTGTGKIYEGGYLATLQAGNPGWVLYCRAPYDVALDPLVADFDNVDEWTPEERAAWEAAMEEIDAAEPAREYEVVHCRLAIGNSVDGFDERIVARAKASLGLA